MAKPSARLVAKNRETGENVELLPFWASEKVEGCHNAGKLGGKTRDGEPIEVTITYKVGSGKAETVTLGKDGTHYLNLFVEGEDDFQ